MKLTILKRINLKLMVVLGLSILCGFAYASGGSPLDDALNNEVKQYFGTGSAFWKFFIIGDLALSTYAGIKSKSPLVFTFVLLTAFVPGVLLKAFVF